MTKEKQQAIVAAYTKADTKQLSILAEKLGGSNQVIKFFEDAFAKQTNNDPAKIETAKVFFEAIKGQLRRIDRQKQGEEILSKINN